MTRLVEALERLGLDGEIAFSGRWVKLRSGWCSVYVIEGSLTAQYYTWCDAPGMQSVQFYRDAAEAIREGLLRASRLPHE